MTMYPPFDALRARIREARSQGHVVTSPAIAKPRFQVVAETVIGPMLRHAAHVLWQEGVPASVVSELAAEPPYLALRTDELGVAVYFWASADPDQLLWALHSGEGYGDTQTLPYDFLAPVRVASLLEQVMASLLGLPEAGAQCGPQRNGAPTATEGPGQQSAAA